jgi:hypothetical protein
VSERWTPALDDYIELAAYLLDVEPSAVRALPRITLAESAVHAPLPSAPRRQQARCISSHGPVSRCERPDLGLPDVELDGSMVERIAAGQAARDEIVAWIARRTSPGRSQ